MSILYWNGHFIFLTDVSLSWEVLLQELHKYKFALLVNFYPMFCDTGKQSVLRFVSLSNHKVSDFYLFLPIFFCASMI